MITMVIQNGTILFKVAIVVATKLSIFKENLLRIRFTPAKHAGRGASSAIAEINLSRATPSSLYVNGDHPPRSPDMQPAGLA